MVHSYASNFQRGSGRLLIQLTYGNNTTIQPINQLHTIHSVFTVHKIVRLHLFLWNNYWMQLPYQSRSILSVRNFKRQTYCALICLLTIILETVQQCLVMHKSYNYILWVLYYCNSTCIVIWWSYNIVSAIFYRVDPDHVPVFLGWHGHKYLVFTVPQNFKLLSFLYFPLVRVIRFIPIRKYACFCTSSVIPRYITLLCCVMYRWPFG